MEALNAYFLQAQVSGGCWNSRGSGGGGDGEKEEVMEIEQIEPREKRTASTQIARVFTVDLNLGMFLLTAAVHLYRRK